LGLEPITLTVTHIRYILNYTVSTEFDIYKLMHFLYNNVLVYNVNIKTLKNT